MEAEAALTDSEAIDALGGTNVVAGLCGVMASAVSNWRRDGIPAARRPTLARALEADRKKVPADWYQRSEAPKSNGKASEAAA